MPLHEVAGAEQAFTAYTSRPERRQLAGDDVGDVRAVTAEGRGVGRARSDPDPGRAAAVPAVFGQRSPTKS